MSLFLLGQGCQNTELTAQFLLSFRVLVCHVGLMVPRAGRGSDVAKGVSTWPLGEGARGAVTRLQTKCRCECLLLFLSPVLSLFLETGQLLALNHRLALRLTPKPHGSRCGIKVGFTGKPRSTSFKRHLLQEASPVCSV